MCQNDYAVTHFVMQNIYLLVIICSTFPSLLSTLTQTDPSILIVGLILNYTHSDSVLWLVYRHLFWTLLGWIQFCASLFGDESWHILDLNDSQPAYLCPNLLLFGFEQFKGSMLHSRSLSKEESKILIYNFLFVIFIVLDMNYLEYFTEDSIWNWYNKTYIWTENRLGYESNHCKMLSHLLNVWSWFYYY